MLAKSGQVWPSLANIWQTVGQIWPVLADVGLVLANVGRLCPIIGQHKPISVEVGRNVAPLANIGRNWPSWGPDFVKSCQIFANIDQCWSIVGRISNNNKTCVSRISTPGAAFRQLLSNFSATPWQLRSSLESPGVTFRNVW